MSRGHTSTAVLHTLSALSGVVGAVAVGRAVVDIAPSPVSPEVIVGGIVAALVAALHIVKEVRSLLGFPVKRRVDDNLLREFGEVKETIGEMRTDYAGLAQILKNAGEEIDRLRDRNDRLDEDISRAMSKVASQMTTNLVSHQDRFNEWRSQMDSRMLALERSHK